MIGSLGAIMRDRHANQVNQARTISVMMIAETKSSKMACRQGDLRKGEDEDLVVLDADVLHAFAQRMDADAPHVVHAKRSGAALPLLNEIRAASN